uniref:C4-dicarboxylate transporter/malic acid transport protein n=2 Tax=Lactuca sativa TaxID=4236 RepID=A0A9R1XXH4_LACSA|nr:hypothetical protein LSAT_V11C100049420 [Lactuca sativa]
MHIASSYNIQQWCSFKKKHTTMVDQRKLESIIDCHTTVSHHQQPAIMENNQEQPSTEGSNGSHSSIITKINAGYFRICISAGAQALLWKSINQHHRTSNLHTIIATTSTVFWCLTLCTLVFLSLLYIMRCIFYFDLVKAECCHHVGMNYLFAPSISWLLLLESTPLFVFPDKHVYGYIWWLLIVPLLALDVKVYGQWFTAEKRFLSIMANPTIQISVIGNLVASLSSHVADETGWKEIRICLFTFGMTHYVVVFITLYQRLSGSNHIPSNLRPVFFLFVATPSMATLAWESINGSFDIICKMLFFLSLFLFVSLTSRPLLFKKSVRRFSVAWWAFSFPLTFLALASISYAQQVKGKATVGLAILLSGISVLVFISLFVCSILKIHLLVHKPTLIFSTSLGSTNV